MEKKVTSPLSTMKISEVLPILIAVHAVLGIDVSLKRNENTIHRYVNRCVKCN